MNKEMAWETFCRGKEDSSEIKDEALGVQRQGAGEGKEAVGGRVQETGRSDSPPC